MASFILVATADWDHPLWTNKQHVAVALAELGHRVLYVESLGLRGPRPGRSDFGRILKRLSRALRPPRQVGDRLWVWSPLVIPGGTSGLGLRINQLLLRPGLALAVSWARLWKPLLWTFNPLVHDYLPLKIFHATVYQCVDRVQAQPGMPAQRLERAERDLCRRVNVVFTTAPELQKALESLNPATHAFGNVADAEHFATALSGTLACPDDLGSLPHPRVLFIGAIDAYKLHLPMLEALARATPQWTYVLIGPVGETDPTTDVGALRQLGNVRLLGPKPYSELPAYLGQADVALLPLRHNDYTRHMFPMKFFEYLAAGCPVVATAIPSLADQGEVALLTEPEPKAFERAIATVLAGEGPSLEQRLERARQHTYQDRTAAMVGILEMHGLLPLDSGPPAPPRRRLMQVWPEVVAALPIVGLAHGLERVGRQRAARGLLEGAHHRWPSNLALLERLAPLRIAGGDYLGGRQLLEALWLDRADTRYLARLLFRRSARPSSKEDQLRLFQVLAESPILPRHLSGYSQVVLTYRAIDFKDAEAIRASLPALGRLIEQVDADPGTYHCLRPNRENRAKLVVSAQLARLHALLTLEDWPGLEASCQRLMRSVGRYDPTAIDLDTAARMTRNILRCLALEVVMAWHAGDRERHGRAIAQIKRLQQASEHPDLDPYIAATQEDHRGFAAELVRQLETAQWSGEGPGQRPPFDQLLGAIIMVLAPKLDWSREDKARRAFAGLLAEAA